MHTLPSIEVPLGVADTSVEFVEKTFSNVRWRKSENCSFRPRTLRVTSSCQMRRICTAVLDNSELLDDPTQLSLSLTTERVLHTITVLIPALFLSRSTRRRGQWRRCWSCRSTKLHKTLELRAGVRPTKDGKQRTEKPSQ